MVTNTNGGSNMHFNTYTRLDEKQRQEKYAREALYMIAVNAINLKMGNYKVELMDSNTGEILFTYENGSVTWIEGNFARELLDWTAQNCD